MVFLDAAGADDKFVSRLAEFIDDNQEVLDAFVSGDIDCNALTAASITAESLTLPF